MFLSGTVFSTSAGRSFKPERAIKRTNGPASVDDVPHGPHHNRRSTCIQTWETKTVEEIPGREPISSMQRLNSSSLGKMCFTSELFCFSTAVSMLDSEQWNAPTRLSTMICYLD